MIKKLPEWVVAIVVTMAIAIWLWMADPGWLHAPGLPTKLLIAFGALLLVVFLFTSSEGMSDGGPMPPGQQRFLAMYLVTTSVVLAYMIFVLMAVEFPDPPATPSATTAQPPPTDGRPVITQVTPDPLRAGGGSVDLQILGFNLLSKDALADAAAAAAVKQKVKVEVGGAVLTPRMMTQQAIVVPIGADAIGEERRTLAVGVTTSDGAGVTAKVDVFNPASPFVIFGTTTHITRETQLLLLVMFAGALGSYIHAIRSLTSYIGNQQAVSSWFWFYITRPFVGVALAIVFYTAVRGGFMAGTPADVKSVSPFGVFAIAALVGMFADKAGNKLADIFEALFTSSDVKRQNPLSDLAIVVAALPPAKAGQAYNAKLDPKTDVKGGKPPYTFEVKGPAWLTCDKEGKLGGTPPAAGAPPADPKQKVTVIVHDAATTTVTKDLSIEVQP